MKTALTVAFLILLGFGLNAFVEKQEAHRLAKVKTFLKTEDARIVWSEGMSDGEVRNFTYWKNDHCLGVIGMKGGRIYFVRGFICSDQKLTKDT